MLKPLQVLLALNQVDDVAKTSFNPNKFNLNVPRNLFILIFDNLYNFMKQSLTIFSILESNRMVRFSNNEK